MKRFFLKALSLSIFLLPLSISAQTAKTVMIKGVLKNFSSQVMIEDLSDMQYLLPPTAERMVIPDPNGNFQITFKLASPNYFRLGRNILYLSPGDDLTVKVDQKNPMVGDFKGKGSQANMFLRATPFPKAGSYMEAGKNAKPTAKETIDYIFAAAALRKKELDELKGVTAEFKRLEAARIKADTINSFLDGRIPVYRPKIPADALKVYETEYQKLSEEAINQINKNFVDFSLMKLVVYRDIADDLTKFSTNQTDIQKINDWKRASSLVNSMNSITDKNELKKFSAEIATIKTPQYKNALQQRLDGLLKFGKGDTAVDFTAVDLKGNPINLASLKGKVIYLDLWATWCGPCLQEMPFLEKLKEKYKDNNNIAFVSLSIDDDTAGWKTNVDKRKAEGFQWLISRNKLINYDIVGIPRTIIIDRSFKIANLNAPVPSSKDTEKIIEELLK
ncbi:MAG: TlpA family protein disulfide reductase [Pyrinomonadaceae bacterium]|nr:TlpA family protein disulfide reductase [Pyrinomonadaceae bacterium]